MGASDKDVKNRIFFRVIFLSPLDEDGSDGRGSFNLCTVKVWNCKKLRKNGSRESITFRLFFIKSSIHERSLIEFETRFLSISNTFLLFPYTWSKIIPRIFLSQTNVSP